MDPIDPSWNHCLQVASLSDLGLRRANNQDSMAVSIALGREKWENRGHVFMVADGMGAHAAGELASKLATDGIPLAYQKVTELTAPVALRTAIVEANAQIHGRGLAIEDFKGMGTTTSVLVLMPQGAMVGHAGDSRIYRWRANRIEQLTFDHSLVWELRAAGQLPEGNTSVPKNIITRSLGPQPKVNVDLEGPFPLQVGDTFLLCSDGLSGQFQDAEIGQMMGCMAPDEAVQSLVDLANLRGGPDNITVIVTRVIAPLVPRGSAEDTASRPTPAKPVHPAVWAALGVCLMGALGTAAVGYLMLAAGCLVGAALCGLVALVQRNSGGLHHFDGRPLGRGPYVVSDATPEAGFVARLAQTAKEIGEAAHHEAKHLDWNPFHRHVRHAAAAAEQGNFAAAVREYCLGISFVMSELKKQRAKK
jgi:serine/threonine protein phosphatase PrpC